MLATAARRGDVVKFGPHHVEDCTITFEQHKKDGDEEALVIIPLHPDFSAALSAMPPSNVVRLTQATTFLTTSFGQPFKTAASFGNWFRRSLQRGRTTEGHQRTWASQGDSAAAC